MNINLTDQQASFVAEPISGTIFLSGKAGAGKTTAAVARFVRMISSGIPAESVLILAPQRTLIAPYHDAAYQSGIEVFGIVNGVTIGGLARRMAELFWPLVAREAGFARPDNPPVFLTLETTEYYISKITTPLLDEGFFASLVMDRNRLFSQIIDNLNKAAISGFSYSEIGERLKSAWNGDKSHLRVFDDAQTCASRFRQECLDHNLLDFSLQVDIFNRFLWRNPVCQDYLTSTYRHIIAENMDEDVSLTHDVLAEWLPKTESALVIYDENGGYRRFLGADPEHALTLQPLCDKTIFLDGSFVMPPPVFQLDAALESRIKDHLPYLPEIGETIDGSLNFDPVRFFPQMVDWTANQIAELVNEQAIPAGQIAVLSPFLSDSLRFSLAHALDMRGIKSRSLRPSRSLLDEPVTQCLLTLAVLAHPSWALQNQAIIPNSFEVAYALLQAIDGLDLIRAQILVDQLYHVKDGKPAMAGFEDLPGSAKERVSYVLGERYDLLRDWLEAYQSQPTETLDHFISLLFGEVLSQSGFGFHHNYNAGEVTANLMESIQKFRWAIVDTQINVSLDYIQTIKNGTLAAQYLRSWITPPEEAVLLAPAYTFLISNSQVEYQFWLDIGSRAWSERIYQPVTHPYVLKKSWEVGRIWTDEDEVQAAEQALHCLITGLLHRCRSGIYLGLTDLGEQGYEQRGPLLQAFQNVLHDFKDQ